MRFFEFSGDDVGLDKFVMILKNFIGRAASKKQPAKLNWAAIQKVASDSGFEFGADYETFKSMYDSSPAIQGLVKNFNADGIELNVPGVAEPGDANAQSPVNSGQTSQDAVDKAAASAAPGQLANQA
jgi:hypothetical protein|tara:strand:- start:9489 stop:9869 length:381 start_codon:yes stop_codon:yes gene_type:complete